MISVVYCTRETNPKHTEHIIKTSGLGKNIEVIEIINNGESLTKCYNRGLKESKNKVVVFMHDDIIIETSAWGKKILKHFDENQEFGILGVAGTTDMPLSGQWWEDRTKMVGIVNHEHGGKKWESKYSKNWVNDIVEVVTVDGLFFCVHKDRIKNNFDEAVEGFHFYEIDFNFSNYLKGVKVGVMFNVRLTHKSIGMTNEQWEENRKNFVKKFNDDLPEKLVPDFFKYSKLKNENLKVKINLVVQSTDNSDNFKNFYDNAMSFGYPNLKITLISNQNNYDELKELNLPKVTLFRGFYEMLPKNLSILNMFNNFIDASDDLVVLTNDKIKIISDIFSNSAKIFSKNKNSFGCLFPLSYNLNKTVFSSSLEFFMNNEEKIAINMKDSGTYYNVYYGNIVNPIGNLSDCIVTTYNNLKSSDWLNSEYETPLYFNELSLKLSLKNKTTYNDTNSLTIQSSFAHQTNMQQDFHRLITFIGANEKLKKNVKQLK
jgi:hypothetical protein